MRVMDAINDLIFVKAVAPASTGLPISKQRSFIDDVCNVSLLLSSGVVLGYGLFFYRDFTTLAITWVSHAFMGVFSLAVWYLNYLKDLYNGSPNEYKLGFHIWLLMHIYRKLTKKHHVPTT